MASSNVWLETTPLKSEATNSDRHPPRLLLLAGKLGYQTRSFWSAAQQVGAEVVLGTDRCHQLEDPWADQATALHFEEPEWAAKTLVEQLSQKPIDGILALGDRQLETAAQTAHLLGLPYNSPESVHRSRSKLRQREVLQAAKVRVPDFFVLSLNEPLDGVMKWVEYPCVLKPLSLSASQGVIRANNPEEFLAAVERNRVILSSPELRVTREPELDRLLVERYIPGREVAVEGLMTAGRLRILAIFDKPDPLEGPFFEETIYVTPSRLPLRVQRAIADGTRATVEALGLTEGPVHAEFRISEGQRQPWVLEAAPRPIGGLCAKALRFGEQGTSLEELLVRHALRLPSSDLEREARAAGVMMIPVPFTGVLEKVEGIEQALGVPGIEAIEITARPHDKITAWPEGSSYLGFIFSRAETAARAERALRRAHVQLRVSITPTLPVEHPVTRELPAAPQPHRTSVST
jgi:biotin carboxylase